MHQFRRNPIGGLDIQAKLASEKYSGNFIKHVSAKDVTLQSIQESGFSGPLMVIDKTGLGLRVPSPVISASDISKYAGHNCPADILGAELQTTTIGDWSAHCTVAAIEGPDGLQALPPAVCIEFSNTVMSRHVEAPRVVRQLDWVDRAWPKHLKQQGPSSTTEAVTYPKVQKFCLIAMRKCFVGFTTGISGSSSWFHVLRGQITFWLLPPLEKNLEILEKWIASGRQDSIFLGDIVEECQRFTLTNGKTLFLPSGWIYAMFLIDDTLAFHGNFLHSFAVRMQHRVWDLECKARISAPRYPFFEQIHWYVLERYVHLLTGTTYLSANTGDEENCKAKVSAAPSSRGGAGMLGDCRVAEKERAALGDLLLWLQSGRRINSAPALLSNPKSLLQAALGLLTTLDKDAQTTPGPRGASGRAEKKAFMLYWPEDEEDEETLAYFKNRGAWPVGNGPASSPTPLTGRKDGAGSQQAAVGGTGLHVLADTAFISQHLGSSKGALETGLDAVASNAACSAPADPLTMNTKVASAVCWGLRKNGCGECGPCLSKNCGNCAYCKDMPKFGGCGKMKQACVKRRCVILTQSKSEASIRGVEVYGIPASLTEGSTAKVSTADRGITNGIPSGTCVPKKQVRQLDFGDNGGTSVPSSSDELRSGGGGTAKRPGRQASKGHHVQCPCCTETSGSGPSSAADQRAKAASVDAGREVIIMTNCGDCLACKDMRQFGGPGKMKKACLKRRDSPVSAQSTVNPSGYPAATSASVASEKVRSVSASTYYVEPKLEPSVNVNVKNKAGTVCTLDTASRPPVNIPNSRVADKSAKVPTPGPASVGTSLQNKPKEPERCMQCDGCTGLTYCRQCLACKDMRRFGGPGKMKKSCMSRRCLLLVSSDDSGVATSSASSSSSSSSDQGVPSRGAAKPAVSGFAPRPPRDYSLVPLRSGDGASAPKQRKLSSAAARREKDRPCRTGKGQACRQRCCVSPSSVTKRKTALERCHVCDGCKRANCGRCVYCKDMKKFGGPGRMRKACVHRRCVLHASTTPSHDQQQAPSSSAQSTDDQSSTSSMSSPEDGGQQTAGEAAAAASAKARTVVSAASVAQARKVGLLSKKLRTAKAQWAKLQMPWRLLKAHDRCFKCEGCRKENCGQCMRCQDMKQFGGPGRLKKACFKRLCTGMSKQRPAAPGSAEDAATTAVATTTAATTSAAALKAGTQSEQQRQPEARRRTKDAVAQDGGKSPARPQLNGHNSRPSLSDQSGRVGQPAASAKLVSQQPLPAAGKAASVSAALSAEKAVAAAPAPNNNRRKRPWNEPRGVAADQSRAADQLVLAADRQQQQPKKPSMAIASASGSALAQGVQQRTRRCTEEAASIERAAVDGLLHLAATARQQPQKHGHGSMGRAPPSRAAAAASGTALPSSRFATGPRANQPKDTGIFIPSSEEAEYRSEMEKQKMAASTASQDKPAAASSSTTAAAVAQPVSAEHQSSRGGNSSSAVCAPSLLPAKQPGPAELHPLSRSGTGERQPASSSASAAAAAAGQAQSLLVATSPRKLLHQPDAAPMHEELSPTGSATSSSSSPAKRQRLDRAGKGVPCRRQCSCCTDGPRAQPPPHAPGATSAAAAADGGRTSRQGESPRKSSEQQSRGDVSPAASADSCGECAACKDMPRFGGPGKMKKACMGRKPGSTATVASSAAQADKAGDVGVNATRRGGSSGGGAVGKTAANVPVAAHGRANGSSSDQPGVPAAQASAGVKRKILSK